MLWSVRRKLTLEALQRCQLLCEMETVETSYEVLVENLHLKQFKGVNRVYKYLFSVGRFKEI